MGNCKDCKHWVEKRWQHNGVVIPKGDCARMPDYGVTAYGVIAIEPAVTSVGRLMTAPLFGCVLFEAKK